ncbi:MAG: AAA family ATPase [Candidatus Limnocylindria bacterium]
MTAQVRSSYPAASTPGSELLTFLIADVRGYTTFTEKRGDVPAARLAARFAEIAREGVEARGGSVIELRGDEALAVFGSARQALRAAVDLQLTFVDETELHPDLPLAVGCGLDAGEAVPVEGGYRGGALNLAARLCAEARGGETLASPAVGHLARAVDGLTLLPGRTLQLKGLPAPVAVLEVAPEGIPAAALSARLERAASRSKAVSRRSDLPPELEISDPVIGRDRELRRLRWTWRQARRGTGRCMAVIGPSGSGKTRLVADLAELATDDGAVVTYVNPLHSFGEAGPAQGDGELEPGPALVIVDNVDDGTGASLLDLVAARSSEDNRLVIVTLREGETDARLERSLVRLVAPDERIELGPVDVAAVREIAAYYLGDATGSLPAEAIREATGGFPGKIHRAVSEWAHAEVTRNLGEAAGRATVGRRDARRHQAVLADTVLDLQRVRDRMRRSDAAEDGSAGHGSAEVPYKGLSTFQADDAALFFGREQLVADLVARLAGASFLAVVGPSGSGKSSVVRAGLLPALAAGTLPGSSEWLVAVMRPGEHPVRTLDRTLWAAMRQSHRDRIAREHDALAAVQTTLEADERLLLVVDQLEEAFTLCTDVVERAAFIDGLTKAARDARGRAIIIATVRADFYGHAAAFGGLAELLAENHALVGPLTAEEYRRAIEEPARVVGARIDPRLTDALIAEVLGEPGALPLLSTALVELWQHRERRVIPAQALAVTGGVRGTVARLAEAAYEGLSDEQRRVTRSVMLRLAGPGDADSVVRRRVPLPEFDVERNPDVGHVLEVLTEARLVTVSEGAAEVAHEALLREWPRLQTWLDEDRSGRRLHRHLIGAATEWSASDRDPGELYRGARLTSALDWTAEHNLELNELEREFLASSRVANEREADRQRRANRRLRALLAGAGAFLVLAVGAGIVALSQRNAAEQAAQTARQAATEATAQRLGAQALVENDLDLSLLLARQGVELHDSPVTRGNLLSALSRSPAVAAVERPLSGRLLSVFASPTGDDVLVSNNGGQTAILDTFGGGDPQMYQAGFGFFGADGRAVLDFGEGRFDVIDAVSGQREALFRLPPEFGGFFVTSDLARIAFTSEDGTELTIHEVGTMDLVRKLQPPEGETFLDVYFFPDDEHILTIDHVGPLAPDRDPFIDPLYLSWWEPGADAPTARLPIDGLPAFATAPDGHSIVVGARDGSVSIHDFATGTDRPLSGRHNAAVQGAGFSADGRTLVTTGDDRAVIVWDVQSGALRETLTGHNGRVFGPAFSADGAIVYTASLDGSLIAWDLGGSRRLDRRSSVGTPSPFDPPPASDVSADGRHLALPQAGGSVAIYDPTTFELVHELGSAPGEEIIAVRFAADGSLLATGAHDGTVRVWSTASWSEEAVIRDTREGEQVRSLEFAPDGSLLLAGTAHFTEGREGPLPPHGFLHVWQLPSGTAARPAVDLGGPVTELAYSPDGSVYAAAFEPRDEGWAGIWLADDGIDLHRLGMSDFVARGLAFSPDGSLLATGGGDGLVEFWDVGTGRRQGRTVRTSSGFTLGLDFDPSGRTLLSTGTDGTARLIDVASRSQLGTALPGMDNIWLAGEFNPDGTAVYGYYSSGVAFAWDVHPSRWSEHACEVAGRNLTRDEWERFLPDLPYDGACPQRGS